MNKYRIDILTVKGESIELKNCDNFRGYYNNKIEIDIKDVTITFVTKNLISWSVKKVLENE